MNAFESNHDEFEAGEYESDHFEFESGQESFGESGLESPLNEAEEMELATELLGVSSEAELDQFVGKLFKKAWGGIKKVAASPLGGMLKGLAKKRSRSSVAPLGSFIPIPGVGTMVGRAIGTAASNLLEFEAEGSPEDQEFELARRFVRLASTAATEAADIPPGRNPQAAAAQALQKAASQLGGQGQQSMQRPGAFPRPSQRRPGGRWYRRGNKIVLLGA